MKVCDRCRVSGCLLNYGGEACRKARKRECPDVFFTNADRIRAMGNADLAILLAKMNADPDRLERTVRSFSGAAANRCLDYLEQPAEVMDDGI